MTAVDDTRWSGDGSFTQRLVAALSVIPGIVAIRIEDAPASRSDAGYNFIANEIFVTFADELIIESSRWLGLIPHARRIRRPVLALSGLPAFLARDPDVGEPDYTDEGMIQYLRTERIVAPYQSRGIKVVEMVRIYGTGASQP